MKRVLCFSLLLSVIPVAAPADIIDSLSARYCRSLAGASEGKEVTLLTMTPHPARGYTEELLGYSLMNALGIRASELGGSDR